MTSKEYYKEIYGDLRPGVIFSDQNMVDFAEGYAKQESIDIKRIEMIEEIKKEMNSWFGIELTDEQIIEYLKENPIEHFDTVEREDFVYYIEKKITIMKKEFNK